MEKKMQRRKKCKHKHIGMTQLTMYFIPIAIFLIFLYLYRYLYLYIFVCLSLSITICLSQSMILFTVYLWCKRRPMGSESIIQLDRVHRCAKCFHLYIHTDVHEGKLLHKDIDKHVDIDIDVEHDCVEPGHVDCLRSLAN